MLLAAASAVQAAPRLDCALDFAGQHFTLSAPPDPDPYRRHSVDVLERFLFTAVVAGDREHIDYVKLYVYAPQAPRRLLLQQATYQAPATAPADIADRLTGRQRIYTAGLEYELQYACAIHEAQS